MTKVSVFRSNPKIVFSVMMCLLLPIQASAGLPGDLDHNGTVSISEVQTAINAFLGLVPSDTIAPSAPAIVTATATSSTAISLSWSASIDNAGVAGYRVFRGATPVGFATSTTFTDANLAADTGYSYSVSAFDAAGNYSAASLSATASTQAAATGASRLIGSWYIPFPTAGAAKGPVVITAIDSSNFMMAHDGDVLADPSGQPGIERGTYTWDQSTGVMTANVIVDTNGQWGFSHPDAPLVFTVSADGHSLLDTGVPFAVKVTKSASNALIGSWYIPYPNGGQAKGPIVITFIDGSNFTMAHDGDVVADPTGMPGIEVGTYAWNQSTGAITANVTVDTNGEWGFSHSGTMIFTVSADGNTLLVDGVEFAGRVQ